MDFSNISSTTEAATPTQPISMQLVSTMNPAQFDSLIKTISLLEKQECIIINNSKICQSISPGVTIIKTDLQPIIGDNISMHILNPRKAIKLFKSIKGNSNIAIYDDSSQQRYVVTNGAVKAFLPKQASELDEGVTEPDLSEFSTVGKTITISKEIRSSISPVLGECDHCELLIHDNQLKGVYVPETAVYLFEEYANEPIDETNADINLKSYSFLGLDADTYDIIIGEKDKTYWMMIRATGASLIDVLESVQEVTDESFLL